MVYENNNTPVRGVVGEMLSTSNAMPPASRPQPSPVPSRPGPSVKPPGYVPGGVGAPGIVRPPAPPARPAPPKKGT
jgi:hypothetical protein